MFRNLFRLFARSARPAAQKASRKLRLETLENRELLSASPMPFVGPLTFEVWLASQASVASASEASSAVVIPVNIEQGDDSNFECELIETTVDTETVDDDEPEGRVRSVVFDPSSLPENAASDDVVILYDSDNNEIGSIEKKRPGAKSGGDPISWPLDISVIDFNGLTGNAYTGKPYPILESCDKASGGLDSSSQYIKMILPTLPNDYSIGVSVYVTVNGIRTLATDQFQIVRVTSPNGDVSVINTVNGQFQHTYSGGGVGNIYYLLAKNNAVVEPDKTIEVKLGGDSSTMPVNDSGGSEYNFYFVNQSVSATIIDDDHWEISATPVSANLTPLLEQDGNGNFVPQVVDIYENTNEGSQYAYVNLERSDNGDNRSGDLTYPISVTMNYGGQASSSDFSLSYYDAEEQQWTSVALQNQNGISANVEIPIGATSLLLRVEATNDLVIERIYETLTVSPTSPHYLTNQYELVSATISNRIKDDDKFALSKAQFLDNLNLCSDPGWNSTTNTYIESVSWKNQVHWVNGAPNSTLPVAYSCDDYLKCDGTFNGIKDDSLTYEVRFQTEGGFYSNWIELSGSSATAYLAQDFKTILGARRALYDDGYTLTWEFRITGENVNRAVSNHSVNPLYVTYKAIEENEEELDEEELDEEELDEEELDEEELDETPVYHTVVHTGCTVSTNSNCPPTCDMDMFELIWEKFESRTISKVKLVNGTVQPVESLCFYGKTLPSNFLGASSHIQSYQDVLQIMLYDLDSETFEIPSYARAFNCEGIEGLLAIADGTCDMWQEFAISVANAQGIFGIEPYKITPIDSGKGFKIKNLPAQGTNSPNEWIWGDHALIKYNGLIYDPSFGIDYGLASMALHAFVETSVESYGKGVRINGTLCYQSLYSTSIDTNIDLIANLLILEPSSL